MLLQLENTNKEDINKLLNFAKQNHLELSLIDDNKNDNFLPGKSLIENELAKLIENIAKAAALIWKMHIPQ